MTTAKPEKPTSKDYAMGYAEGFNDGCAPKEPDDLTIAYMSGFADGKKVAHGQACFDEGVSSVHTPDRSDKAVMQQALDALLGYKPHSLTHAKEQGSAIIALREAIARPIQPAINLTGTHK